MRILVTIFETCFLWGILQAQEEIEMDILNQKCGKRPESQTPAADYKRFKTPAPPNTWPWHVGLYSTLFGPYPFCGGTLISSTWVLTAAHCVIPASECTAPPRNRPFPYRRYGGHTLAVRVGDHDHTQRNSRAFTLLVKHIVIHPNYPADRAFSGVDIALLKLTREVKRSSIAEYACLPESGFEFPAGTFCNLAGWGLIPNPPHEPNPEQPKVLMETRMPIANLSDCMKRYPAVSRQVNFCTDSSYGPTCTGDSGGGLHCLTTRGKWIFYGVYSYADRKCLERYSVHILTEPLIEWITDTTTKFN
ncbi:Chymotrypsin-like elastase member 2A [Sparganum proliferum]